MISLHSNKCVDIVYVTVLVAGLVDIAVRKYFNLDIASWVNKYDGPVKLIRRTQDEMIST